MFLDQIVYRLRNWKAEIYLPEPSQSAAFGLCTRVEKAAYHLKGQPERLKRIDTSSVSDSFVAHADDLKGAKIIVVAVWKPLGYPHDYIHGATVFQVENSAGENLADAIEFHPGQAAR